MGQGHMQAELAAQLDELLDTRKGKPMARSHAQHVDALILLFVLWEYFLPAIFHYPTMIATGAFASLFWYEESEWVVTLATIASIFAALFIGCLLYTSPSPRD